MKIDTSTVACITGGADGIGLAIAKEFLQQGASVALLDVRAEVLESVKLDLCNTFSKHKLSAHKLDVRGRENIPVVLEEILHAHGNRISVLVNCAGVVGGLGIPTIQHEDFDRVIGINLTGTFNMCKALFPVLAKEKEAYIVNISSLDGLIAMPRALSYVTSKFAVTGFTKALCMDLSLEAPNVRVASVHPGFISTNMIQNNHTAIAGMLADLPDKAKQHVTVEAINRMAYHMSSTTPQQCAKQIMRGMYWNQRTILVGNDTLLLDLVNRLIPSAMQNPFVFAPVLGTIVALVRFIGKPQLLMLALWFAWRRWK